MSIAIVNDSDHVVNPFDVFKSKADRYATAVHAESVETYNNGDQYVAIIHTKPLTKLFARPHSMKILAKRYMSSGYVRSIEVC